MEANRALQAFLAHSLKEGGQAEQQALRIIKKDKEKEEEKEEEEEHQSLRESLQRIADKERELLRRFMSLLQERTRNSTKKKINLIVNYETCKMNIAQE